jgi:drug/metabolite transporter (DMT)-like permease
MHSSLRGLILGAAGVLIFSLTMPMTRIALADGAMSAWFVWAGRAVVAALAGAAYLLLTRARMPPRQALWPLLGTVAGVIFGWPLLNTIALETVSSSHAAVVNGILPLSTAVIGAALNRERLPRLFWICAVAGTVLVCTYAWLHADGTLRVADMLMLAGVLLGGLGYACGAMAARHASGPEVISWALILALPGTLVLALFNLPGNMSSISIQSWSAFAYLGLMSQWFGFFFWYRGLLIGGIAKVSQVQLMQLFLTLGFSALLLNEFIEWSMYVVAALTLALIYIGRKSAVPTRREAAAGL